MVRPRTGECAFVRTRQTGSQAEVAGGVPGSLLSSGGVMSKISRSLLWSGLVAAGVAACGDDVSVLEHDVAVHDAESESDEEGAGGVGSSRRASETAYVGR